MIPDTGNCNFILSVQGSCKNNVTENLILTRPEYNVFKLGEIVR